MAEMMKGNEAIAEAAVRAGVKFYAGYPITPSSEIMNIYPGVSRKWAAVSYRRKASWQHQHGNRRSRVRVRA